MNNRKPTSRYFGRWSDGARLNIVPLAHSCFYDESECFMLNARAPCLCCCFLFAACQWDAREEDDSLKNNRYREYHHHRVREGLPIDV